MLALVSLPPVPAFSVFDDILPFLFVEMGAFGILTCYHGVQWMAVPEIVRGWRRILVSLEVIPCIETDIPGPEDIWVTVRPFRRLRTRRPKIVTD
jgi:hypothetical protein